jgi:hypothetical protein
MKQLNFLMLMNADISEQGLSQIREALPNTEVSWPKPMICIPNSTNESKKGEEKP